MFFIAKKKVLNALNSRISHLEKLKNHVDREGQEETYVTLIKIRLTLINIKEELFPSKNIQICVNCNKEFSLTQGDQTHE